MRPTVPNKVVPMNETGPALPPNVVAEYLAKNWRLSEFGRLTTGQTDGPCARRGHGTIRYGPYGSPLCSTCREDS